MNNSGPQKTGTGWNNAVNKFTAAGKTSLQSRQMAGADPNYTGKKKKKNVKSKKTRNKLANTKSKRSS